MLFAVPAFARTTAPRVVIIQDPAPDPIGSLVLSNGRIDWSTYAVPGDLAGYDVRYTTTLGQSWAQATDLAPGLQISTFVLVSAFPAAAAECLVAPVDAAGQYGFPPARQALVVVTAPPPITQIALQSDRVAWTYAPPADFAGYDVRYTTTLGGSWAAAAKLYPALQPASHGYALLSDFPAAAVECLVAPVNTGGAVGLPEARQGGLQAPTNRYALGPAAAFAANWTAQPGDATVTLTNEAAGVVVDCGTADSSVSANMTLWATRPLPPGHDWTWKQRVTQLDTDLPSTSNGIFVQLVSLSGGRNGSDANPNLWTTAQYRDGTASASHFLSTTATWDKYGTGWRFSYDQDALTLANDDQLRGHGISGGTETNLDDPAHYAAAFPVAPNVAYDLAVQWRSGPGTLTWTLARADGTGTPVAVPVTDSTVAGLMGAYLGLNVSAGRKVRFENASLTDDGGGGGGGGGGEPWRDDPTQWATLLPLAQVSAAKKHTITSASQLATAITGGGYYVISNGVSGNVTIAGKSGSLTDPIVICGDSDSDDPTTWRAWNAGQLTVNGCSHVYVRRIAVTNGGNNGSAIFFTGACNRVSVERVWGYGQISSTNPLAAGIVELDARSTIRYWRVRYCKFGKAGVQTENTPVLMQTFPNMTALDTPSNYPKFGYVYRNELVNIYNISGAGLSFGTCSFLIFGTSVNGPYVQTRVSIYENYLHDCPDHVGECVEIKCSDNVIAYNTFERGANGDVSPLRVRFGRRNLFLGNLFVCASGQSAAGMIELREQGNEAYNNWSLQLAAGETPSVASTIAVGGVPSRGGGPAVGSVTTLSGSCDCYLDPDAAAYAKAQNWPSPRPNAAQNKIGGNRMRAIIGDGANLPSGSGTGSYALPCPYNVVAGATAGRVDRNYLVSLGAIGDQDYRGRGVYFPNYGGSDYGTAFGPSTTDSGTSLATNGADYGKVPTRWISSDVGVACTVYA